MLFTRSKVRKPLFALSLVFALCFTLYACVPEGGIVILEDGKTGFSMEFKDYNSKNKCELLLDKGDEVQVEITCDGGKIDFTMSGKKGSEPYSGNDVETTKFTITVAESDDYVFELSCKYASGKIVVKKLEKDES